MNNFKKYIFNDFSCDLWTHLRTAHKPILIYGMGNGADKIISVLEKYDISYSDVFASDGFVRGHSYRGKVVISYSEACEKYGDFIILLSFGTHLDDVMQKIYNLDDTHELYAPDVPVCEGDIFNEEFFDAHIDELISARSLFADKKSKLIFDDIIRFKLTGKLCYLKSTQSPVNETDSILRLDNYKTYVDLGAYNGDTIKKYSTLCTNLKKIYAFEPDLRNFKKLKTYCDQLIGLEIHTYNYASWNEDAVLSFSSSGNRNSTGAGTASHQSKLIQIEAKALDNIVENADFIKYDVEGAEFKAICGSKKLIEAHSPDLLVSMYHKSEDLFKLPLLIHSMNTNYNLYLRRLPCIPAWDLNLYAIKNHL